MEEPVEFLKVLIFQVYLTVSSKFSEQAILLDTDLISNSDFQRSFLGFFSHIPTIFLKQDWIF